MTNLYLILGVKPSASEAEIKSAYRKLSIKTHPDHGGDAEHFAQVSAAYEVLGDPDKREEYDAQREEWLDSVGAVGCSTCGEANRVKRLARGKIAVCAECRSPLPVSAAPRSQLVEHAAVLGIDLAHRGLDHTKALLTEGIDLGFASLRKRLTLGRKTKGQP